MLRLGGSVGVDDGAGFVGGFAYDSHGNATSIAGETHGYDGTDRHLTTVRGAVTVTYRRDASDRIVARTESISGGASTTTRFGREMLRMSQSARSRSISAVRGGLGHNPVVKQLTRTVTYTLKGAILGSGVGAGVGAIAGCVSTVVAGCIPGAAAGATAGAGIGGVVGAAAGCLLSFFDGEKAE